MDFKKATGAVCRSCLRWRARANLCAQRRRPTLPPDELVPPDSVDGPPLTMCPMTMVMTVRKGQGEGTGKRVEIRGARVVSVGQYRGRAGSVLRARWQADHRILKDYTRQCVAKQFSSLDTFCGAGLMQTRRRSSLKNWLNRACFGMPCRKRSRPSSISRWTLRSDLPRCL